MSKMKRISRSVISRARLCPKVLGRNTQQQIRTFGEQQQTWGHSMHDATALEGDKLTEFYDDFSKDYDNSLGSYGWRGPSVCSQLLVEHGTSKDMKILDCGCGTGMVGEALIDAGFNNIVGCDISEKSLDISGSKSIYKKLFIANLEDFDIAENDKNGIGDIEAIVSVGVMTYIRNKKGLFERWSEVIEDNGIIIVSHRTDMMEDDINVFEEMESDGLWERVHLSDPIMHITNCEAYDNLTAQFYVAKVKK